MGGEELLTRTVRTGDKFITYGNASKTVSNGYWTAEFNLKISSFGQNPKVAVFNSTKKLLVNLNKKETGIQSALTNYGTSYREAYDYFELSTSSIALLGVLLPIDRSGHLFRFSQIIRLTMRFRYINVYFGKRLETFMATLGEIFESQDSLETIIKYQNGTKGKYNMYQTGILYYNQMHYKTISYLLGWVLRLISVYLMHRTMKTKKIGWLSGWFIVY